MHGTSTLLIRRKNVEGHSSAITTARRTIPHGKKVRNIHHRSNNVQSAGLEDRVGEKGSNHGAFVPSSTRFALSFFTGSSYQDLLSGLIFLSWIP
jgi:hypothetical protein